MLAFLMCNCLDLAAPQLPIQLEEGHHLARELKMLFASGSDFSSSSSILKEVQIGLHDHHYQPAELLQ